MNEEFLRLENELNTSDLYGSDSSIANLFLLKPKYNIELNIEDNILFRKYNGIGNRYGYGFPIALKSAEPDYLKRAVEIFLHKNTDAQSISFCLFTQAQKNIFDECLARNFPSIKVEWNTTRDDCDYIYLTEKLAQLKGKELHKKKNHVSQFLRIYENQWEYRQFPQNDIAGDILQLEEEWYSEKSSDVEKAFDEKSLLLEKESIKAALENSSLLHLTGGVIYINGKPCAMCLASPVSDSVMDIHFEKVLSAQAQNGGYAAINNFFAKTCSSFLYINREEDMGVEGLRHAKLSYKPAILLDKFYGKVCLC